MAISYHGNKYIYIYIHDELVELGNSHCLRTKPLNGRECESMSPDLPLAVAQIDPAGQYFGYKAAAAGTKDQEAAGKPWRI